MSSLIGAAIETTLAVAVLVIATAGLITHLAHCQSCQTLWAEGANFDTPHSLHRLLGYMVNRP
jgi:hypothetical protein